MYQGQRQASVAEGLAVRQQVSKDLGEEMNKANRSAINTKGFELEAQRIATLMRDQIRLGFVDVGGWDTHVNEGGAQGALANTLDNLGRGLAPYAHALGNQWKNTVVVVSKFGRTFREKRQQGQRPRPRQRVPGARWQHRRRSHRGRASCAERAKLLQDRDYPVLNDYRALLGGLFTRMWGLSPDHLQHVFPEVRAKDLTLV